MDTAVLMEIESLRGASMADLREKYQEVFQEETRCRHREHLFRRIAWRLQALAEGDLSERARGRAHQIAQDGDLRINAPRDFFAVGHERVRRQGSESAGTRSPPAAAGRFAHSKMERADRCGGSLKGTSAALIWLLSASYMRSG